MSMSLLAQFIDGCGRPCAHAETLFCFRFLDQVDMPVIVQRQVRCLRGGVVDTPIVAQMQIPMVRFTIVILQLQYIDKVVVVCCGRQLRSHSCSLFSSLDKVVDMPVVFNPRCWVQWSRSCSTSVKVVDIPVDAVHRRFSRPCDHAATVATVDVPQIQFIAGVCRQSSSQLQ